MYMYEVMKKCTKSQFKEILKTNKQKTKKKHTQKKNNNNKLASIGYSSKRFHLTSKLFSGGDLQLPKGYLHVWNDEKNKYEFTVQRNFFETRISWS